MTGFPRWLRALMSALAGLVVLLPLVLGIAVIDLYFTGHGRRALTAPLVDWDGAGLHLSVADLILFGGAGLAGFGMWKVLGFRSGREAGRAAGGGD